MVQIEYQKQKKEVIDNYRGFQTMDSKDHPVVQQGIKAAEITSNVSYKAVVSSLVFYATVVIHLLLTFANHVQT